MSLKPIHWTSKLVTDFWDGISQSRLLDAFSFSALAGSSCLQVFQPFLDKSKVYLDFGGGDGHLAALLCSEGFRVATYDPSEGRSKLANDRLSNFGANYLGSIVGKTELKFDGIFLIEVAEHILDDSISSTYRFIHSLLKPGGLLFLTTPNKEDLALGCAYEPQTGAFFHRWQHVRSFDRTKLTGMLKSFGFHEVLIHEIDFRPEAFNAMNETIANAGVTNPFAVMRPVIMGAQSNLAGIFSTEQRKFKIDKTPYRITIQMVAQIPADAHFECHAEGPATLLPAEAIHPDSGQCYWCALAVDDEPPDSAERPEASRVRLFEGGEQLGPRHTLHDEIRQFGGGAYSHWGGQLYFSSSDGSDPRSNGRRYEIRIASAKQRRNSESA
jgi:2-polyprenyl-3-methyl-5-hydroxy-6-metoxy-1,4-benzoquinol methylase